jgi:hypothetical protein
MAKLTQKIPNGASRLGLPACLALAALVFTGTAVAQTVLPPEELDAKGLEAFKQYWSAFQEQESKAIGEAEKKFKDSWAEVRKEHQKQRAHLTADQLATLEKAAKRYRQHLDQHDGADNKPFVMLNLAQILNLIGDHRQGQDESAGTFAKNEALALLTEIEKSYRDFASRDQALYLRALILESLDRDEEALTAWQSLAASGGSTLYGLYARVAAGDHLFKRDRPAEAMQLYQKALTLLPDVKAADAEFEHMRINYRLAWAAYRAAELNTVITAGAELLVPGRRTKSVDRREKIQLDAVELMGNALYENNAMPRTMEVLRRKEIALFAPAVGLRTATRYSANNIHNEAVNLGEMLIEEFPLAADAPAILQVTADSYGKLGKTPQRLATLEKLALLLPAQSLWRSRHKHDMPTIQAMEEKAAAAAVTVATQNYETGLAAGNVRAFSAAISYYEILLEHAANAPDANMWRLRRAHCHYFAGNYDEAVRLYTDLKANFKVSPEILQLASYQLVLASEKRWRDAFASVAEKGNEPLTDEHVKKTLADLERSVDEFAARFPGQSRAVDLLLVGASANRDMNKYDGAAKYWQRALVSQPSPAQRGVAIRGLVFASMKTGSTGDVVELARRFLKLEDWRALGLNLGNELRGVLSTAALDEGKRLNNAGQVREAGEMLTAIAREFPDVPDRDKIYRDGGYMLALAGDWAGAQKAADGYLASGLTRFKADMTYLLARAHEYQLRLHDAAKRYFELGDRHAAHARSLTSLQRAEKLALAEGDFALAAQAASVQAERARNETTRLADYARAVEHLGKAKNPGAALNVARRRWRNSKGEGEKLKSQLLVARTTYEAGSEQEALDEITIVAKQADRSRGQLSAEEYAAISSEANFLLGEESRRRFEDFRILERSGAVSANIAQKSRYFEDLVSAYDKAAAAGDPGYSPQARYRLAEAAETFADEIAAVPNQAENGLTVKAQSRYQATIQRLQELAKRYHGANVLAARKAPRVYRDNEWIKRSTLRLSGDTAVRDTIRRRDEAPMAIDAALPSEWSL